MTSIEASTALQCTGNGKDDDDDVNDDFDDVYGNDDDGDDDDYATPGEI